MKYRKYKFLHILWHDELKFNIPYVEMINLEEKYFNKDDHLFITPHKTVYENLSKFSNVKLVKNGNLINRYGNVADWIFVHYISGCGAIKFLFTKKRYAKKVIMRSWGGNELRPYISEPAKSINTKIDKLVRNTYAFFYHRIVKNFCVIGVANIVDVLDVQTVYGKDMRTYPISYGYTVNREIDYEGIANNRQKNSTVKVLIGNSANSRNKHIEILDILSVYKNENIDIYLILSYGAEKDYIDRVEKHAESLFGEKVHFIRDFMNVEDYTKFISTIDIGIIADTSSRALGLLFRLSVFESKIYVERNGKIASAIEYVDCIPNYIDTIVSDGYCNFIRNNKMNSMKMKKVFGRHKSNEERCTKMKHLFDMLDSNKKGN